MKKKILIVTTTSETLAIILKNQPAYLNEFLEVYLAASNKNFFSKIENNENIVPHHVPMYRGINPLWDLYSILRMIWLILKIKPHIVHSYTPKAGMVSMIAAFFCRVPIRIHTFTGLIFPGCTGFKKFLLKSVDKFICLLATRIIPEGVGVRSELLVNKVTDKNLDLIGNGNIAGIDTNFFSRENLEVNCSAIQLKAKLNLSDKAFIFIYIGRLNRDKGIDELVAAFELLGSINTHLLVIGGVDSSAPIKKATLDKLKALTSITWLGFQDDVRPALALANVLVLPSYREGFPNVLMQAGAMEVPSISTAVSGANEILKESETGFIVPIKDVDALVEKMNYVLNMDRYELERMGKNARKRVCSLFEKSFYLEKLKRFYISELAHKKII